jgi:hypothetical protein
MTDERGNAHSPDAPVLAWPPALKRPVAGRPLVYLDLNHWISLAKAAVGHAQGEAFREILIACRSAVTLGAATFALAGAHYFEVLKIESARRRRDVAEVMEDLTQFKTLLSRPTVMKLELSAALDFVLHLEPRDPEIDLLGRGVLHAFGQSGSFRIRERASGADVTSEFRERFGAQKFDAYMTDALLDLERGQLRGPKDEAELQKLRALGYDHERVLQGAQRRAEEEQAQRLRLDGGGPWRRERLPDVISARELWIEFQNMAPIALQERGVGLEDVLTSPQAGVAFMRSMPSTEVAVTLKTAWHRNRDKPWSANDIYDVDAMALAVPYCDIVVTEKACHHALVSARMDKRMNTVLLRDLARLPAVLMDWKAT